MPSAKIRAVLDARSNSRKDGSDKLERTSPRCFVLNLHFEFTVNEIAEDVLLLILGWSDGIYINDAYNRTVAEMHRDVAEKSESERMRAGARQEKRKAGSTAMN